MSAGRSTSCTPGPSGPADSRAVNDRDRRPR
jgi:hypothetical protein